MGHRKRASRTGIHYCGPGSGEVVDLHRPGGDSQGPGVCYICVAGHESRARDRERATRIDRNLAAALLRHVELTAGNLEGSADGRRPSAEQVPTSDIESSTAVHADVSCTSLRAGGEFQGAAA